MKAFKGFNNDMTCRDFQYEEGKEYEEREAIVCKKGFHACEYPLDCFSYYSPNNSIYHEVEQSGNILKCNDDTKVSSTKIKIGAKISIAGLVKAAIEYTKERINPEADSDDNYGASSATGYKGASSANDPCSIAVAWGYHGKAKGVLGSFLVLANWDGDKDCYWEQSKWKLKGAKMVRVDGEQIKPDTWYTMINGEVVEVDSVNY